jgi:hypothetical protein
MAKYSTLSGWRRVETDERMVGAGWAVLRGLRKQEKAKVAVEEGFGRQVML